MRVIKKKEEDLAGESSEAVGDDGDDAVYRLVRALRRRLGVGCVVEGLGYSV